MRQPIGNEDSAFIRNTNRAEDKKINDNQRGKNPSTNITQKLAPNPIITPNLDTQNPT